jgi:hypothetical protein
MAAGGDYGVQSGSGNVMLGANTGAWLYNWVKQHLPRVCDSQAVFYRPWEKGFLYISPGPTHMNFHVFYCMNDREWVGTNVCLA